MIHHDALGHTGPTGTALRAPSRRWLSPGVRLPNHRSMDSKERKHRENVHLRSARRELSVPALSRTRRAATSSSGTCTGTSRPFAGRSPSSRLETHDRVISLGDLVARGPDSFQAKIWIEGKDPSARFDLVIRGNHEQMMLAALVEGPRSGGWNWGGGESAWSLWMMNGGGWWRPKSPDQGGRSWIDALRVLPFCARVETRYGPVGLVHACPVHDRWQDLEEWIHGDGDLSHLTRTRALWSRVRHGHLQREIGETGREHLGPVEGVRCVVTGHTPVA